MSASARRSGAKADGEEGRRADDLFGGDWVMGSVRSWGVMAGAFIRVAAQSGAITTFAAGVDIGEHKPRRFKRSQRKGRK